VLCLGRHIDADSRFQPMSFSKEFDLPDSLEAEEDLHLGLVLMGRPDAAGIIAKNGHAAVSPWNDFGIEKKARKPAHTLGRSPLRCFVFRESVFGHILSSL
jgi:hypothetical protein